MLASYVVGEGVEFKKTSVTQKEKSKGTCKEGYLEKSNFLLILRIHD